MEATQTGPGASSLDRPVEESVVQRMVEERSLLTASFFDHEAERIAGLCSRMADRFADGGRLIAVGASPAAASDVRHVTVEFVHPVIVGKRALPAIGITSAVGDLTAQVDMTASAHDMVIAFGIASDAEGALSDAIAIARARGCLTIAFDELGAEAEFRAPTVDAFIWQELVETLYHILWELVHVFFEHGFDRALSGAANPGSSGFLYPFLTGATQDLVTVTADVARSVVAKATEVRDLRGRTLGAHGADVLARVAHLLQTKLSAGGTVLAMGNGGSATDSMDLVADLRTPPRRTALVGRRAWDLTEDTAILTALANDVGPDIVFARQIIAYGTASDVAVAFTTSGSSRNIVAALGEARRRGLATVAFAGYDGGRIAAEGLADYVIVAPSQYVPRIQEAHATAYHVLRSLIG